MTDYFTFGEVVVSRVVAFVGGGGIVIEPVGNYGEGVSQGATYAEGIYIIWGHVAGSIFYGCVSYVVLDMWDPIFSWLFEYGGGGS